MTDQPFSERVDIFFFDETFIIDINYLSNMDIALFIFFIMSAGCIFVFSVLANGGVRMALGFISAAFFILMAVLFATGETITSTTILTDSTLTNVSTIVTELNYGFDTSNLVILFSLFGVLAIFIGASR